MDQFTLKKEVKKKMHTTSCKTTELKYKKKKRSIMIMIQMNKKNKTLLKI